MKAIPVLTVLAEAKAPLKLTGYQQLMSQATGITNRAQLRQIEQAMRQTKGGELDSMTLTDFNAAAVRAQKLLGLKMPASQAGQENGKAIVAKVMALRHPGFNVAAGVHHPQVHVCIRTAMGQVALWLQFNSNADPQFCERLVRSTLHTLAKEQA